MTDSDCKMLELAAKAAGYLEKPWMQKRFALGTWNPLTDSSDRYQLARACQLTIDFYQGVVADKNGQVLGCWSPGNVEDEARAIVRAAAESARQM